MTVLNTIAALDVLLVGGGSLLVRCGELLMARGHRIKAVVSADASARAWGARVGIAHYALEQLSAPQLKLDCDILFSIGNYAVLPDAVLKRAKRMSVNYHYGPLPEYSGLHVPSWAIAEQASDYAITWHRIGELVDGGSVLKRVALAIDADDTALSLGLKCDEHALASFDALLGELATGTATETAQDIGKRRYFSRQSQFPAEGLIDWERDAGQIAAMVRAADYGPFSSPLVWPKVAIGGRFFAVRKASVGAAVATGAPGAVVRRSDAGVVEVATGGGTIELDSLSRLDGEPLDAADLALLATLQAGACLPWPNAQRKARIDELGKEASRSSAYWHQQLAQYQPYRLPQARAQAAHDAGVHVLTEQFHVTPQGLDFEISAPEYLLSAWCLFLARASGVAEVHLALTAPRDALHADDQDLFYAAAPLLARIDASAPVALGVAAICADLRKARAQGLIRCDLVGREPDLAARARSGDLSADIVISPDGTAARFAAGQQRPALELVLHASGDAIDFHYDTQRLARADVSRLAQQFADWCSRMPAAMATPLQSVAAISKQEYAALVENFNDSANAAALGGSFHQLFERSARRHADKVALLCADEQLSYAQLNARANRLARALVQRGVGRGERVGVCLDRSIDLVVALLAAHKAGAVYVPVDLNFPAERVRAMLDCADPVLLMTAAELPDSLFPAWHSRCLRVDEVQAGADSANLDFAAGPDDLAYIIFTSGSSGKPKGVEVTHGALCNFLASMQQRPGCDETDRLLAITTISFDIAALELFLPLLCGASVVIAQTAETTDGNALLALMRRHGVTMMQATPASWDMLLQSGWQDQPSLGKILCGGEALPRQLADKLLSRAGSVWNMYGPTETTVWSSAWRVAGEGDIVIGTPIANTQLYVLDANLAPVPAGFPGELCIGGAGVARGYHKDALQSGAQFHPNPFHPGMLYKTGDLACFRQPGMLSVLGRNDGQIKLRGFRIELGEVEAAIAGHAEIARAVVVGRNDQLVAYCLRSAAAGGDGAPARQAESTALAEWSSVWDSAYQGAAADPTFNIAGWKNSYDGAAFSNEEMRDWQRGSIDRILSYAPNKVFEVGCGTGLMLFGIAPHCRSYRAVDMSAQAVALLQPQLASLPQASCETCAADALPELAPGSIDTVIINSVAQYFPSAHYLLSVLEWAADAVTDGRIFIGDVRDLALLDVFHADIVEYGSEDGIAPEELRRRIARSRLAERELVVAPEFFANLPSLIPRIGRVEIALRNGEHVNEMTRYRYDVTLHIGAAAEAGPAAALLRDWQQDQLDLGALRDCLGGAGGQAVAVSNIPNARLADVFQRVGHVLAEPAPAARWTDPRDLRTVAREAGYEVAFLPSRARKAWAFDAVFHRLQERAELRADLAWLPAGPIDTDQLTQYANVPAAGAPARPSLDRLLRPWLENRLPAFMVPAFFVELEQFPMTPNGKIDRKALPQPTQVLGAPLVLPRNELERSILAIWTAVLGHDRIGVNDSFFKIGGNSLRVVRVQAELQNVLGRPVSTSTLYEFFTIKNLAAHLAGAQKAPAQHAARRKAAANDEDIAIVAMTCRLPGGVNSPDEFWDLLERGGDGIVDVLKDRWDAAALYDPDPDVRGKSYCKKGGFVSPIDVFDAPFFGVSPREARALDPAQRMMLEVTWEAFEQAGYSMDQLRDSQTGVFIGIGKGYHEYGLALAGGLADLDGYVGTGSAGSTMSGRVSYVFGLEGPSMTVDTACSSSLVATHLACNALRQGECETAVAGGVTLMLSPDLHVEFSRLRGMSPDGRCKSFSADTDGTGWSEGAALVVLKRLSDAQRDGDPILAVLRGTAVNHAGHSASLTTPSGPAQQRVIRQALAVSGLEPGDIDYLEAHGTGTKLGDPIEGNALSQVFGGSRRGEQPLWVGSVKSNLGHTQAAAGLAGVMKAVLAMQNDKLPRTLHVTSPTPSVDWEGAQMALVQEEQPWPRNGRPRRAGVSSFGIGGTNAHVIVEEAPPRAVAVATAEAPPPPALPFVLSGFTVPALRAQAEKLSLHLGMNIADRFVDVAYSLACTRTHFRKRLVLFAKDKAELLDVLASYARTGEKPAGATSTADERAEQNRIALLFTGQGSQLPGMGRGLYAANAVFRQSLDAIAAHFSGLEQPLLDVMWGEAGSAQAALLNRTDFTQPALFALEVSLWRVWESLGVQPDFLLGHSIGELAAAHVAGVFDLADACRLVAARGRLMQALPAGGAMASLEASGAEVEAALQQQDLKARVAIAGLNAPQQTVVSGDADGIERIVAHFAGLQRKAKQLTVSHAFHSHLMEPMLAQFHAVAASIGYSAPTMTLVSSLTGQLADPAEITQAHYWVSQAREAVRFNDGMRTLHAQGVDTYLELGPQAVLSGMGAACLADDAPVSWIASLGAGKDDVTVMQKSMAELHVLGTALDWRAYFAPFGAQRVALPSYAFQRERYWFEPMAKNEVGAGLRDAGHQLLGGGVRIAGTDLTMFTTAVAADEPVWVQEHQVMEAVLMPGTAFFEAMRAAGNAGGKGGWDAAEVIILAPLVLTPGVPVRMQVSLGAETNGARPVQVYSSPVSDVGDEAWQLHAEGKLVAAEPARHASVTVPPRGAEAIDVSSLYADLAELGYGYGPTFQGIRQAWHADDVVWAHASLPESVAGSAIRYGLHPALLDSAMHALLLTQRLRAQASDDLYVPFEVERLTLWREGLSELWVAVAEFEMGEGEFWASLDLYDAHGACVGRLHRLHARRVDRAALRRLAAAGIERFHFDMAWRAVDTKDSVQAGLSGTWGVMQDGPVEWVDAVRGSLAAAGAELVDIAQLSEAASFDGVVCLWGANPGADVAAQTHDMAARALAQLQSLASAGFQAPVVWVTRGAVGTDSDDRVADIGCGALWGLMRTARNEHPELSLRIVDLGEEPGDLDALPAVLALEGEPECAVRRGQVLAARLEKATAAAGLVLPADGMWRLDIATKGRLDLPLVIKTLADEPLGAGEIRAAVMATGVNFLDVLNALGMVEIPALGFEFAGVVSAVGASVKGLKAGDAILGLARGSFGSVVVADARQVVRMPDNLSFEEAATIPMTFLTAWYGLHDLGAMRAGERVLIHAAAGGVGMAAVQLARLHGAEVFGTASDAKWDALRALGLDDAHIASSRNLAFVDSFNQTTGGQRFDIVLNSLAREFIDASLAMLGKGGRFLEMGKIDLREQSWIDAHHPGVSYQVYNLPEAGPERIQQMLLALAGLFAEGKLKPLPVRTFPINCASDALRFMAQARHVGKVVLVPPRPRRLMMAEGAVLVTGGTGGLGRYVAKWLATQHHVKDLVLTSRSGERSPEAQAIIAELAELGATATVLACDAADNASLQAVMAHFTAQRPLRGVVHAAGVLDDGMLTSMTPQRLDQVFAPKVDGGWNLHLATQDLELDFFVLFSSISGVTGTPGQANYAAANTFLDALAYYRRARGLPATSVAWGAWDGQGMATRLSEADRMRFSRQGMDALTLAEGVQLLEAVVLNGKPMAVAAALDLGRLQKTMEEQTGQAPALYRNLFRRAGGARTQGAAGGGANLRKALGEAPADQHEAIVLEMVRAEVAKALEFGSPDEVDVGLPLQDIGIDSLTAVLLRNQLSDMSGLALPAKIAFDHPNLRSLGKFMLSKLQEAGLVGGAAAAEVAPVEASAPKRVDDKLARQGCLAPELQFGNAATALRAPGAVFLTGATGFVGAFVLHELLKAKVSVHCLVRAPDAAQASARLQQTLEDYGHWEDGHAHLLHPVVGDLSLPLFGLPEDEFDRLAGQVDAICHSGALVDWMQPLDAYLGPNVVGTHEVLRLASRGRGKAVHFISSVATLPKHLGYAVSKDDREYGYLTSKWMAEQMVSAARRRGALASVYRLPFVGAAAGSGHFRLDQGDFLHNLIVGCIGIGSFPALDIGLGAVLPVDYLSRTVVTAMTQDLERIGKDYDFVNPAAPDFGRFAGMINAAGCEVAMLPYAQWQAKALQYAKAHKASALARIAAVLDGMDQADVEMLLTGFPPGPDVLGGKDYPCPAVNAESVQRYVDRIVATVYPPEQKIA